MSERKHLEPVTHLVAQSIEFPFFLQTLGGRRDGVKQCQHVVESNEGQIPFKGAAVVSLLTFARKYVEVGAVSISLVNEWHRIPIRLHSYPRLNLKSHADARERSCDVK